MSTLHIVLAAAAVWRITHLLQLEDGPFAVFKHARGWLRRSPMAAGLAGALDCFYCLSLWVAAPCALALARSVEEAVLLAFALSGFAILINRVVAPPAAGALYYEEPETPRVAKIAIVKEKLPCPVAAMHETHGSAQRSSSPGSSPELFT